MSAALACPLTSITSQLMGALAGSQSVGREKGHGIYSSEGGAGLCFSVKDDSSCYTALPTAVAVPEFQEGLPRSAPSVRSSVSLCGLSPVLHQPLFVTLNTAYCFANSHFNKLSSTALLGYVLCSLLGLWLILGDFCLLSGCLVWMERDGVTGGARPLLHLKN